MQTDNGPRPRRLTYRRNAELTTWTVTEWLLLALLAWLGFVANFVASAFWLVPYLPSCGDVATDDMRANLLFGWTICALIPYLLVAVLRPKGRLLVAATVVGLPGTYHLVLAAVDPGTAFGPLLCF